jgi:hypothetical protein
LVALDTRFAAELKPNYSDPDSVAPDAAVACLLDPRLKNFHVGFFLHVVKAKERVLAEMGQVELTDAPEPPQKKFKSALYDGILPSQMNADAVSTECTSVIFVLLLLPLNQPPYAFAGADYNRLAGPDLDAPFAASLDWWKQNKSRFPRLAVLARRYLCCPATSSSAERLFSASGEILSERRTRLSAENLSGLVLIQDNSKLFAEYLKQNAY